MLHCEFGTFDSRVNTVFPFFACIVNFKVIDAGIINVSCEQRFSGFHVYFPEEFSLVDEITYLYDVTYV